jgi:methanogenic corrinoid protein MtbC1
MLLEKIAKSLAGLNKEETLSLTVQAILEGETSQEIVLQGLFAGLDEVAKRYAKKQHLYPDMYKASIIFHEALAKIKHQIVSLETKPEVRGAIDAVQEGADFIGISIMTDEGVQEAKKVVQGLKDAGIREQVKVIVGGAGVNAPIAAEIIEADGYAEDAGEVVEFLKIFFRV